MSTIYDIDANTHTIAAAWSTSPLGEAEGEVTHGFAADPNTHTVAAAWSSSPLGQPEDEVSYGFAATGPTEAVASHDEPTSATKRATLAAALLVGIGAGAALGVVLFGYADPAQPAVVVPGSGAGPTSPQHAVVVAPSSAAPAAKPAEAAPAPKPLVSAPRPAGATVPAPQAPTDPGSPPVSDPTVIIDIPPLPPLPDKPDEPDPEPPNPQPPSLDDLKIPQLDPEPPNPQLDGLKPKPKPDPPTLGPALPATVFAP